MTQEEQDILDPIEGKPSDSTPVVATLRQQIVSGQLAAGARLAEIPVAESLGLSRTPVRLAFRALEQEGLLEKTGKRGYVVRRFSEADVRTAIEVRGTLEGLAARHLAERGMSEAVRAALAACVAEGEAVLAKGHLVDEDIARWSRRTKATSSPTPLRATTTCPSLPPIRWRWTARRCRPNSRNCASPSCSTAWCSTRWSAANRRAWRC